MKAVITVIGKDMVGLLARVSTTCAEANANVLEVTQSVLQDYFAMNGHGFAYYWYSPSTMSRLSMLDSTNTFLQPSMWEAFSVLMIATILVQLLGVWIVGKTEIHKTSSRE